MNANVNQTDDSPMLLRKITVKDLMGDKPSTPAKKGQYVPLCHVFGLASDVTVMSNDKGEYARFSGRFNGVALTGANVGTLFESFKMIIPEPGSSMLFAALNETESKTVEFAFEIGVKQDDKSMTGYIYMAKPLFQAAPNDPMAQLRSRVNNRVKELAGPPTTVAGEPAKG